MPLLARSKCRFIAKWASYTLYTPLESRNLHYQLVFYRRWHNKREFSRILGTLAILGSYFRFLFRWGARAPISLWFQTARSRLIRTCCTPLDLYWVQTRISNVALCFLKITSYFTSRSRSKRARKIIFLVVGWLRQNKFDWLWHIECSQGAFILTNDLRQAWNFYSSFYFRVTVRWLVRILEIPGISLENALELENILTSFLIHARIEVLCMGASWT